MMQVRVPDGRIISVPTEDVETAKKVAIRFAQENPIIQRGAQLGEEDVSVMGDLIRAPVAGLVQAAAGVASLPAELIDLATLEEGEESTAQAVTDFFDKFTPDTHTGAGEAVKFMTQFIVPGGFAAKAAGKTKSRKPSARQLFLKHQKSRWSSLSEEQKQEWIGKAKRAAPIPIKTKKEKSNLSKNT